MSKVVFVGNVPYNMGEEQLIDVFKSVGQVVGFRLVFDRDTGKPKGYGFCEFSDHQTAMSAVRNLNGHDLGGRPLRIDLADSDPFLEGKTTIRGELVDGEATSGPLESFLADIPPGQPIPPNSNALDMISQVLATMNPSQLMEVLAQMKAFVITHPENARALLIAHPQLSYALFQGLLMSEIVDSTILQRMLQGSSSSSAELPQRTPPSLQQMYPSPNYPTPPQQPPSAIPGLVPTASQAIYPPPKIPSYYQAPVPPQTSSVPSSQSSQQSSPPSSQEMTESQKSMVMQVLSLTFDQINALPESERTAIQQLRSKFMGTM